ncbi:MAG: hypothetical protein ACKVW3_09420 [Phycisphaerales bacterium]
MQVFFELLWLPDTVIEIRAPKCCDRADGQYPYTSSGYFQRSRLADLTAAIVKLDTSGRAPGIYFTLNPVSPALLARSTNTITLRAKETSADADVVRRATLLIDCDPARPSGISSTDAELEAAIAKAAEIRTHLMSLGWPEPLALMSGNGAHLLFRIDLPTDDGGLVKKALAALSRRFSDARVKIDESVFNPARISKIAGTMTRKGKNLVGVEGVEDRPHRRSSIISKPAMLEPVPRELLEGLAATAPEPPPKGGPKPGGAKEKKTESKPAGEHSASGTNARASKSAFERFEHTVEGVRPYLERHGLVVTGVKPAEGGTYLFLDRCPVIADCPATGGSDIAVFVGAGGELGYKNLHDRGKDLCWTDLREALEPGYRAYSEREDNRARDHAGSTIDAGGVELVSVGTNMNGRMVVSARSDGQEIARDSIDQSSMLSRKRLIDAIGERIELDQDARAEIDAALRNLTAPEGGKQQSSGDDISKATIIIDLVEAEGVELFHTPGGHDSEGYATITLDGHRETMAIGSGAFKRWLARLCYVSTGAAAGGQALTDAKNVLAGKAIHEGQEREVYVRLAEHGGDIYLDLADKGWHVVRVTRDGWSVISSDEAPVRFVRKRGMLALPIPVTGGSIDELRDLINVPQPAQWILIVAFLVAALRIGRPTPILAINGEHGSCKSTTSKMVRALVDPNKAMLRSPPKDERDLVIAARNSLIVGYDNLSGMSDSLSDAICRLSTGGGFGTRELYANDDEILFDSLRPVIVNGIDDVTTRPDALDRSLSLLLPVMDASKRRDEEELWSDFYERRPRILGALLTAVSTALRNLPTTKLTGMPRMADFAKWIVAAEPALPWAPGEFMAAYTGNRNESNEQAVENALIGPPIVALMRAERVWAGTAGELLAALEKYVAERARKDKRWPTNPKAMASALRRLAPNLRALGIAVSLPERGTGHTKRRIITLEYAPAQRSARSASSAEPAPEPPNADSAPPAADRPGPDADHSSADADRSSDQQPADGTPESGDPGPPGPVADRADRADRSAATSSNGWGTL